MVNVYVGLDQVDRFSRQPSTSQMDREVQRQEVTPLQNSEPLSDVGGNEKV